MVAETTSGVAGSDDDPQPEDRPHRPHRPPPFLSGPPDTDLPGWILELRRRSHETNGHLTKLFAAVDRCDQESAKRESFYRFVDGVREWRGGVDHLLREVKEDAMEAKKMAGAALRNSEKLDVTLNRLMGGVNALKWMMVVLGVLSAVNAFLNSAKA